MFNDNKKMLQAKTSLFSECTTKGKNKIEVGNSRGLFYGIIKNGIKNKVQQKG